MTQAKPRGYHHGDLREALLLAGRKLVEEQGIRGFTLRECARRAAVSHAAPAHHFASMDDLLGELAKRGFAELASSMRTEAARVDDDSTARLVAVGVGYMAFAAANPVLFQLMFAREANGLDTEALTASVEAVRDIVADVVGEALGDASEEVRQRMTDFAWASMHGFIALVLDGGIGGRDSSRTLKARGLAALGAMAETVVRSGRP